MTELYHLHGFDLSLDLVYDVMYIVGLNIFAITANNSTTYAGSSVAEQNATQDEFSPSVASLYDTENPEQ